MKKLLVLALLALTPLTANAYARPQPYRPIVIHEHNNSNQVIGAVLIGVGITLFVYAITREQHDYSRLTYRF